MLKRIVVISALAAVASLLPPRSAFAQASFADDFESDVLSVGGILGGWDGPHDSSVMYVTDQMAHSGHRSLELRYDPGSHGSSFMYRLFPGQDAVYVRWYQRWSPGFIWEPSATKMTILRPLGGYPQFYPEVLWADGQLAIQAQVTREAGWDSENFYQNRGDPVVFGTDRWYCIEVYVALNTPGAADGHLAAWIDGELKLQYDGREFRGASPLDPAPSTAQIQAVGASGYYGGLTPVPQLQFSWQDDYAISSEPIGFEFLSDDFEEDTTDAAGELSGWDGPSRPSLMHASDQASHSGTRSLELDYTPGSDGAGYMYHPFKAQDQVYVRWFQRWSTGFVWQPSANGLVGLETTAQYPQFYPFTFGADAGFGMQAQVVAEQGGGTENFFVNRGPPVNFRSGRWYCIEVLVKLNAPGNADGQIAAWIDGDLKLFYDRRQFRGGDAADPAPPSTAINSLLVTGQYGGMSTAPQVQFSWQDDFVGSTQRLGCGVYPAIVR